MVRSLIVTGILFATAPLFGQQLEFGSVQKLPATVNSAAEESMPMMTPAGDKLFFSRALFAGNTGGEYAGEDIWMSERVGTTWKKSVNTLSMNNKNNNVVVGMGSDGKTLYFIDASPFQKMNGVYKVRQQDAGKPELIPIPGIDNQDFVGFYVSPDLDVIFLSMKTAESKGNEDLYFTTKDNLGNWSKPKTLGATINTAGFEISPFLSADKKRLYFSSNGHGGQGDADIFYSERLYDSWETWTVPVNLGNAVNSPKFDAYFSIYGDSVAYFASNRDGSLADLYRAHVLKVKTILANGQHYLTPLELDQRVGRNVNRTLTFARNDSTLTKSQEELLFYIVNKLMLEKEVNFHLVIKEEEDAGLSKSRLQAIKAYLRHSGIDPARVHDDQLVAARKSDRGAIEILLFQ